MQYSVITVDGKEYGPVDVATLKSWADESRLTPQTMLKDFLSGQVVMASSVPGIFGAVLPPVVAPVPPAGNWQQPPTAYPRTSPGMAPQADSNDMGIIWGVILRSVGGVLLFFVFHGIGLFVAGYGLYYAIKAQQSGHKNGTMAIAIASIALVVILIGWVLRAGGARV